MTENTETDTAPSDNLDRDRDAAGRSGKDLQSQTEEHEATQARKFGTFAGVFTPTLLTILGVIMFLRLGWVTGNAGLGGAWLIILLAFAITGFTGLAMATFVTNIRVGAGGAFSMISQSLGLEVGGAIGIPLYLSQALAVVMYVFGFRAGWEWAAASWGLPTLPSLYIDLIIFALIFGITWISTSFAMRLQYVILVIIVGSLISIGITVFTLPLDNPIVWWGDFPGAPEDQFSGTNFWIVFAVFFPAATGIMAGANMSGDLKAPRRAIPYGTMGAIIVSLVIYLALAYWLMRAASVDELTSNYTIMIDRAYWGPAVLGGLLAATFSSALASFVGAPRILQALGSHSIVPGAPWFARTTQSNEPRNASLLTALIVLGGLMLRDLNAIAPLISMIFLLTYATINLIVLIEQRLRLLSFRPQLKIPSWVPLAGLIGCLVVMFVINPLFSLVAIVIVVAIYFVLTSRKLNAPFGDVRSGVFSAMAEWSAKRVRLARGTAERAWKPNILLPVEKASRLRGEFELVYHLAFPMGSVKLLGFAERDQIPALEKQLRDSENAFQSRGVFTTSTVMAANLFPDDIQLGMQALAGSFFRPNLLFLQLPKNDATHRSINEVIQEAERQRVGTALFVEHEHARLGRRHRINLWLPDQGEEWKLEMEYENLDLAILLAYRLLDSWKGELNIIATIGNESRKAQASQFLERLVELARLPANTEVLVADDKSGRYASSAPTADLQIFPLDRDFDSELLWHLRDVSGSSCLFTRDGGDESALS